MYNTVHNYTKPLIQRRKQKYVCHKIFKLPYYGVRDRATPNTVSLKYKISFSN